MNFISTSGTLCCHVALLLIITFFFLMIRRPPRSTLFPTRRSSDLGARTNASMRKLRSYETEIFAEKQERWHRRRHASFSQQHLHVCPSRETGRTSGND